MSYLLSPHPHVINKIKKRPPFDSQFTQKLMIISSILILNILLVANLSSKSLVITTLLVPLLGGILYLLHFQHWGIIAMIPTTMIVPFEIRTDSGSPVNTIMLLIPLLTALWLIDAVIYRQSLDIPRSRALIPLVIFMVISCLAFLAGQIPWFPIQGASMASQIGGLSIFVFSALTMFLVTRQIQSLIWLQWLTWIFIALGSLYMVGRSIPGSGLNRLVHPGATGSLFWVWFTSMVAGQLLFNRDLRIRWRFLLCTMLLLTLYVAAVQSYQWKSGWLPPLVALTVLIWFRSLKWRGRLLWIAGLPLFLFMIAFLNQLIEGEQYSWITRLVAWEIVLEITKINPLLGLGPSNYYFYTPLFNILGWNVQFNSHNQYVDILAQTGIAGIFCLIWLFWEIWRSGWRLQFRVPTGFQQAYVYSCLGGLAGTATSGFLGDWFLPFVYNIGFRGFRASILAWIFLGGLLALEQINLQNNKAE